MRVVATANPIGPASFATLTLLDNICENPKPLCSRAPFRQQKISNNGHDSLLLNNKVSIPTCIVNCREKKSVYYVIVC